MTALTARNITVRLDDSIVLNDVDFSLPAGEITGLIGPNGAGKTTLLRTMAGLTDRQHGTISLDDRPIEDMTADARARRIAYLAQDGGSQWPVTVETLVMLGRLPHMGPWHGPASADRDAVNRALVACDAVHLMERPVNHLSGGERARVLLARALAGEPRFLLADEPVAGLDPAHALLVMETLEALATSGTGIALIVHDLTVAARYCRKLVLLHEGKVAATGSPAEVLSPENLSRFYGIRAHDGFADGKPFIVPLTRIESPNQTGPRGGDAP